MRAPVPVPAPPGVDAWCAPFTYDGVARELVARVKYRNARAATPWLADAMAALLRTRGLGRVDAVVWAPTTAARRRGRGFDHAQLLAEEVASRLGRPVSGLLVRRDGVAQTGRPSVQRRRGGPEFRAVASPPRILLVDDVTTTGATLRAAAGALRRAGAVHVVAVTAARTPPPQ
jgi:predicted amidophosphoribosyltransferase